MISRIVSALVIVVIVIIVCVLLGALLTVLLGSDAVADSFFKQYSLLIGFLAGLYYFFFGDRRV